MERCVESFLRNATLHGGFLSQEIHGDFSNGIEIFCGVTGARSAGVFFEGDIKTPVQFVFNTPVRPDRIADLPGVRFEGTDVAR